MSLLTKICLSFISLLFAVMCVMTTSKRIARVRRRIVGVLTAWGAGTMLLALINILVIPMFSIAGIVLPLVALIMIIWAICKTPGTILQLLRKPEEPNEQEKAAIHV